MVFGTNPAALKGSTSQPGALPQAGLLSPSGQAMRVPNAIGWKLTPRKHQSEVSALTKHYLPDFRTRNPSISAIRAWRSADFIHSHVTASVSMVGNVNRLNGLALSFTWPALCH